MLEAYFDESGDPSDPKGKVFALAWLVASEEDWKIFTGKWSRILRRFKVTMMHMKDFEHSTGEFRGWDKAKKDSFASQLAGILKNTIQLGHSHSMSVEVWQNVVSPKMETTYKKKRGPYDPSLKTRPCRTGNSVPPAARFGPPVRQTLGV
jgi:hypothetical protein